MTVKEMKELFELTAKKVAQIDEQIALSRKETDEQIALSRKETDEQIALSRKETDEQIARSRKETDEEISLLRKKAEKHREEAEKHREEAEKHREEAEKHREEAEKHREEADAYRKKTEETFKRLTNRTDNIAAHLGSYTKRVANIAEDYFYKSLKKNPVVNGIKFDKVSLNEKIQGDEYDIVLSNGTTIMIISVKTNLKPSHIYKLINTELPRFRNSYNNVFGRYKIYGAVASLTGNEDIDVLKAAEEAGILVLGQTEDNQASVLNPNVSLKVF